MLAVWSVSLAILHAVSWKGLAANAKLVEYWSAWFLPWDHGASVGPWLSWALRGAISEGAGLGPAGPVALLAVVGAAALTRNRPRVVVVVAVPLLVALLASALRLYPFAQRLLLFAAPIAFVLVAAGVDALAAIASRLRPGLEFPVRVLLAVLVLVQPVRLAFAQAWRPPQGEHLRPALEYLLAHRQPGDGVYVYYGAKPAFRFYSHAYRFEREGLLLGRAHRGDPPAYLGELDPLRSRPRGWLVFAHACPNCPLDEKTYLLGALEKMGTRVDAFDTNGAGVYLFEFSGNR